jgi:hypothetical protein
MLIYGKILGDELVKRCEELLSQGFEAESPKDICDYRQSRTPVVQAGEQINPLKQLIIDHTMAAADISALGQASFARIKHGCRCKRLDEHHSQNITTPNRRLADGKPIVVRSSKAA